MAKTPLVGIDLGGASTGAIHQDRLLLAGSAAISDLMLASAIGDHTDFRIAETDAKPDEDPPYAGGEPVKNPAEPPVDADGNPRDFSASAEDGFWFQQVSSRSNTFHAMIQQEGLFIFGDLGEATVPTGAGQNAAFTADNVAIRENSWYGTEIGRTVLIVGGLIIFIQKGGEDVRGIEWSEAQRKYDAPSLLVLSGNLFDRAVDMSFAPSKDRRSDTVYLVGASQNVELDGQLAVLLIRQQQPYFAWSRWTTAGRIVGGASPLGSRVFLVERGGDPARGIAGTVALETMAPDGTDDMDAPRPLTVRRTQTQDGLPYNTYDPLPVEDAWMAGLTDLDGLAIWHVDTEGETLKVIDREDVIRRRGLAVPQTQPVLMVSSVRIVSELVSYEEQTGIIDGVEVTRPITTWRAHQPDRGNPETPVPEPETIRARVGLTYERRVETLPFVARKQTGTSTRLRPGRIMEVNVDLVLPAGYLVPLGRDDRARVEDMLRMGEVEVTLVSASRGRERVRIIRRAPRITFLDTPRIARCRYGGRAGFRDRLAINISARRHIVMSGLAYRAIS